MHTRRGQTAVHASFPQLLLLYGARQLARTFDTAIRVLTTAPYTGAMLAVLCSLHATRAHALPSVS